MRAVLDLCFFEDGKRGCGAKNVHQASSLDGLSWSLLAHLASERILAAQISTTLPLLATQPYVLQQGIKAEMPSCLLFRTAGSDESAADGELRG